jgi:hypothetical protein
MKTRLLKIREKQLLGRNGEFWPNMLNFWVMVLAAVMTASSGSGLAFFLFALKGKKQDLTLRYQFNACSFVNNQ